MNFVAAKQTLEKKEAAACAAAQVKGGNAQGGLSDGEQIRAI
jgi:hypothetical protein